MGDVEFGAPAHPADVFLFETATRVPASRGADETHAGTVLEMMMVMVPSLSP